MANKRIIICSDGTWNRPEQLGKDDYPTNILKTARGVKALASDGTKQVVFYDWGVGSYYDPILGGAFGMGLNKNIMDAYRFLVHNYEPGDDIYLFGFSRGAYTIRSLCGMINNCSILKPENGSMIEAAFELYKTKKYKPNAQHSIEWKSKFSHETHTPITFVGVYDTVGSLGLPFSIFNFIGDKDNFYDNKLGRNVKTARHALALGEMRDDFAPTLWQSRHTTDLEQVFFLGAHSDVGGGYKPDKDGALLADIPLKWMITEAQKVGLDLSAELIDGVSNWAKNVKAKIHNEYKGKYKLLGKHIRIIPDDLSGYGKIKIHESVKRRCESGYNCLPIKNFLSNDSVWPELIS